MRYIVIIVYILLGLLSSVASEPLKVNVKNESVEVVFKDVIAKSGMNYICSSDVHQELSNSKCTINTSGSLNKILTKLFENTKISYTIRGKNIILKLMSKSKLSPEITISGYVRDSQGEALIGAVITDLATNSKTVANNSGFYTLTLPKGKRTIVVSYIGFNDFTEEINFIKSSTFNITLNDVKELEELIVVGNRHILDALENTEIGKLNVSNKEILNTPTLFGESDVIKTLQLQPGVSAGIEALAGMYVHGGNNDENLYMLDNVPLYQVNHFGGLFSAFNTEAIKNVDFYKSSFPAKYDGRLSSIIDIHTKDGSMKEYHGSFKLGLTSGSFNIDGPIWKDHTTFNFAIRRSWYDVLSIPALAIYNSVRDDKSEKTIAGYSFMDINAKINHHFNSRSRLYMMFYYGNDRLKGGSERKNSFDNNDADLYSKHDVSKISWGNIVASLGWNYMYSDKLFGEITASFSKYNSKLIREDYEQYYSDDKLITNNMFDYESKNSIVDWSLRTDYNYIPNRFHSLSFGINYVHHDFLPEFNTYVLESDSESYTKDAGNNNSANEFNGYISHNWHISDKIRTDYGLHFSLFNISSKNFTGFSPRFSFRYKINDNLALKASYNRATQYVHQLTESSISLPTDQWVPISGNMKPQSSDKISIGGYYNLNNKYIFSVETYYKWMKNIYDYSDEYYTFPSDAPWDTKLVMGNGTAKGIDFQIRKEVGKFTGHISYSLLWADRTFAEKNNGITFPAKFDNRHKINICLNWKINDKWEINASWTGMSGNMFTLSTQNYDMMTDDAIFTEFLNDENGIDLIEGINNYRLPFYHRLDIGVNRYTKNGMWNFSLYNAYSNMNVISIRKKDNENNNEAKSFQLVRMIPIIPSVSYTWFF